MGHVSTEEKNQAISLRLLHRKTCFRRFSNFHVSGCGSCRIGNRLVLFIYDSGLRGLNCKRD